MAYIDKFLEQVQNLPLSDERRGLLTAARLARGEYRLSQSIDLDHCDQVAPVYARTVAAFINSANITHTFGG